MDNFIVGILIECWGVLKEAAPYVLFGFFAAGVLKALIPDDFVARHLGKKGTGSVLKASLFGVPLPLCSCGVIPVAIGLRKQGASKGATASFLVSVPETGVDSIAITWALLDPIMTVIRPVSAFLTAVISGLFINLLPEQEAVQSENKNIDDGSGACAKTLESKGRAPFIIRLKDSLRYAFTDLLKDIGKWLLLGIVIAGTISYFVPDGFFETYLGGEFTSLLIMLVVGIPLYICASASTPIAAAMVLKGLSPGAALVFLLAGPATNAATMTVIAKYLGRAATLVYLSVISILSLIFGWLVNQLYAWLEIDIVQWANPAEHNSDSIVYVLSAVILLGLLSWLYRPRKAKTDADCCGDEQPGGG